MLPTHRPPTHPGEMLLKEFLEPLGVSQAEAADRMRIPFQRLNGIVKGRRAVSADTALLLDALTGWDAQIWLTLQAKWDLWHALKARGNRPKVRPLRFRSGHHVCRWRRPRRSRYGVSARPIACENTSTDCAPETP
jgi:addiction module HigA family antidote